MLYAEYKTLICRTAIYFVHLFIKISAYAVTHVIHIKFRCGVIYMPLFTYIDLVCLGSSKSISRVKDPCDANVKLQNLEINNYSS